MSQTTVPAFQTTDFDIFTIDDFDGRMNALWDTITPKLEGWGEAMREELAHITGHEIHPHVARHRRRRKNPAPETWVAFGHLKRGYKKDPCLGLVANRHGLQARVMVKHEGYDHREDLASRLPERAGEFDEEIPDELTLRDFYGYDIESDELPPTFEPGNAEAWKTIGKKAGYKTKAFDVGHAFDRKTAASLDVERLATVFEGLFPIYQSVWGNNYPR